MVRYAPQTNIFKDFQGERYYVWREKKKESQDVFESLTRYEVHVNG